MSQKSSSLKWVPFALVAVFGVKMNAEGQGKEMNLPASAKNNAWSYQVKKAEVSLPDPGLPRQRVDLALTAKLVEMERNVAAILATEPMFRKGLLKDSSVYSADVPDSSSKSCDVVDILAELNAKNDEKINQILVAYENPPPGTGQNEINGLDMSMAVYRGAEKRLMNGSEVDMRQAMGREKVDAYHLMKGVKSSPTSEQTGEEIVIGGANRMYEDPREQLNRVKYEYFVKNTSRNGKSGDLGLGKD